MAHNLEAPAAVLRLILGGDKETQSFLALIMEAYASASSPRTMAAVR